MEKFLFTLTLIALLSCYYFFYFNVNLIYGAISYIATLFLCVAYAVRSSVNTLEGYDLGDNSKK